MKKNSAYGMLIILVLLVITGITVTQYLKAFTILKDIKEDRIETYTGLCTSFNEVELISRTRNMLCTFQMDNNTTLKMHGGIFQTDPETINELKDSEIIPFTYKYIDVHVLWKHDYWVISIQQAERSIITLDDSLKYYENGLQLYRVYFFSGLAILLCGLAACCFYFIVINRKPSRTLRRKTNKGTRYKSGERYH